MQTIDTVNPTIQVGRVSPGLRLVHEALWCGTELRARPHVR